IAVKLVGPEHQTVRTPLAFQIGLGQRRALIRQMRLVIDQADAPAEAMLTQRGRELETRVARAGDQNCPLGHCATPARYDVKTDGILQSCRGLSPLWFCYLNAPSSSPKALTMPMPDHVALPDDPALLRIEGPIATLTLNRPGAFNSIDLSIAKKLEQLSAQVESSDDIRVLVIEGEGRAFCAGGDLQTIGAAAAADNIAPVVGELLLHYHAFIETVRRMPKIVLSSVHGSAAGAGMGLAFVADLCIASDDARFTPAYAKLGVSPDGGGTAGGGASVGARRPWQTCLSEDTSAAAQAHGWGLG